MLKAGITVKMVTAIVTMTQMMVTVFQHQTHQVSESGIENKQTYLSTTKTNSCESASTQLPVKLMLLFRMQINNNYSLL